MKSRSWLNLFVLILTFFMTSAPGALQAQEQDVYTLKQGIEEALEKNLFLKAVREKTEEARHVESQARADFLPKLGTSYGYTRLSEVSRSRAVLMGGGLEIPAYDMNTQDNYQWKATLTQPLFTGFALTSVHELAKLGVDLSEADHQLARLDLILAVKEAYFNILKAEKREDVADKAVEFLQSNAGVAQSFYREGMIPINDLLKAEVELANALQELVKAQNGVALAGAAFNTLLVRPVNEPVEVEDILTYRPERAVYEEYLQKALERRPEILAVDINLLQADQQIRLARSAFYPEAGLRYDYIKEGDDPGVSGSPFHDANHWQVTVGLDWTFFEWGKTRSAVREKRSIKRQIMDTKAALEDQIGLEIKQAILDLDVADRNIPTTEKAMEQAEENLRVSRQRYRAQVTTMTEVLDAQTLLTQARTNYYNALYDHNLAKARLRRALGED
ncbi:MAG: TolC family protein [Desulfatiglandales bacterium]